MDITEDIFALLRDAEKPENIYTSMESEFYFPAEFHGITRSEATETKSAGEAFSALQRIAVDPEMPKEDRFLAVRYMAKIPLEQRIKRVVETAITIINDERYPIEDRYYFFSNSEKMIRFDGWTTLALHLYYYGHFPQPLLYKVFSAQYLLQHWTVEFSKKTEITKEKIEEFLIGLATDKEMSINIRSEAADILIRHGKEAIGRAVILELGDSYTENKLKSIYSNSQNVHDRSISDSIIKYLRNLTREFYGELKEDSTFDHIFEEMKKIPEEARREKIIQSLKIILLDTAKYEGLTLREIAIIVWKKILASDSREELKIRLSEELYEMNNTCSTGYLSRLLNVLSGFIPESVVSISYSEQLRNNVFARLNREMKTLSQADRDQIILELSEPPEGEKTAVQEFIIDYSPREELYREFVDAKLMAKDEFETTYQKAVREYAGLE